jgi:hypothetical protein
MFSLVGRYNKPYIVILSTRIYTLNISQVILQYDIKKQFGYIRHIYEASRQQLLEQKLSNNNKNRNSNRKDSSRNVNTIPLLEMVNIFEQAIVILPKIIQRHE